MTVATAKKNTAHFSLTDFLFDQIFKFKYAPYTADNYTPPVYTHTHTHTLWILVARCDIMTTSIMEQVKPLNRHTGVRMGLPSSVRVFVCVCVRVRVFVRWLYVM